MYSIRIVCNYLAIAVVALLAALMLGCVAETGAPEPAGQDEGQSPFSLTAEAEKAEVVLGEPIYLDVRLSNDTDTALRVFPTLGRGEGQVHVVLVSAPEDAVAAVVPLRVLDIDVEPVSLAPGEVIGDVIPVFYGVRGWTAPSPGTYVFQVIFEDLLNGGETRSEPVEVEVVPADGAGRFVLESEVRDEVGKLLLWQAGDHLEQGLQELQAVVEEFPESPLAAYARFVFGWSLSRDFKNYAAGRLRPANCPAALSYLEELEEEQLPTYLRVQTRLARARCYLEEEAPERVEQALAEAEELIAGRPEYAGLEQQVQELRQELEAGA